MIEWIDKNTQNAILRNGRRILVSKKGLKVRIWCSIVVIALILLLRYPFTSEKQEVLLILDHNTSHDSEEAQKIKESLMKVHISPLDHIPVSPLEAIPVYDEQVELENSSLWGWNSEPFLEFRHLDMETRCKYYFRKLYTMDENWSNNLKGVSFNINDADDDFIKDLKDELSLEDDEIEFRKRKKDIALQFQRARIYDKCFLQNNIPITTVFNNTKSRRDASITKLELKSAKSAYKVNMDIYALYDQFDFEHRIFPFIRKYNAESFNKIVPLFSNGNGTHIEPGYIPIFNREDGKARGIKSYEYDKEKTFWGNWNKMSSMIAKRGIVMSFSDKQIDDALRLIATLRLQKNKLPIQIVYKGNDISQETMSKIHFASVSSKVQYPQINGKPVKNLPSQEVWFIDVSKTLDEKLINDFQGFKNKWLAVMFNLFEEFVFLDTDAISYVDFNKYFETEEYASTGTTFFRDRVMPNGRSDKCSAIFRILPPKILENVYFENYPSINDDYVEDQCYKYLSMSEKVYKNYFQDGLQHQMESGLVVMDRIRHTIPLVIAANLHMAQKVDGCSYGDKEFFWLGFLVAGHKFSFYPTNSGAIGKVLTTEDTKERQEKRICSIQVAHFSSDNHLWWINGGTNNCKFPGEAEKDWEREDLKPLTEQFDSLDSFKKHYEVTPIDSEYGIIADSLNGAWNQFTGNCRGYTWCARYESKLRAYSFNERKVTGTLFKFDDKERKKIEQINYMWAYFDTNSIINA